MNKMKKWAITLAPFVFVGCAEQIEVGTKAQSGDDVLFAVENTSGGTTRTMYQDDWDAVDANNKKTPQAVYWGNYLENTPEHIKIYCPNTDRGFAEYEVKPEDKTSNVAATVVKVSDIGVQWGAQNTPHTFYAFYPASKTTTEKLEGEDKKNTIVATVDSTQSPKMYKQKETQSTDFSNLAKIESFVEYNKGEYDSDNKIKEVSKTIYGMPDMSAAVMMAKTEMTKDEYGNKVPLVFNVLADVLDLTFNGPVSPNTLGGNAIQEPRSQIKIQTVTIDVVVPEDLTGITDAVKRQQRISEFKIDNTKSISGDFKLDMDAKKVTGIVDGNPTVTLETAMGVGNPTLFVRKNIGEGVTPTATDIDHLRLRAFLIPGQITGEDLGKLRIHIETDCGDFYEMLNVDKEFVSGQIYPVKLGYFKQRGQEFDLTKWIGQLDPNIYLSELSIPGAWHAGQTAFQGTGSDGNVRTFQEMYNAGVRAFEVQCHNGTEKYEFGENFTGFDTKFKFDEKKQYSDADCFSYIPSTETPTIGYKVADDYTVQSTQNVQSDDYTIDNQKYSFRRLITVNGIVTPTKTATAYMIPKFALRLYRSGGTGNVSLSDRLIELSKALNPDGLIFIEIGMTDEQSISANYCRTKEVVYNNTPVTETFDGYQYATTNDDEGWAAGVIEWEYKPSVTANSEGWHEVSRTTIDEKSGEIKLDEGEAWAIAVRSCLERLKNTDNPNTENKNRILYSGDLDEYTTIGDVAGHIIAKVNTNAPKAGKYNENQTLWGDSPALFSRWIGDSGKEPRTINMKWKSPVEPNADNLHEGLRWCYTELDNIKGWGYTVEDRKNAIKAMNTIAFNNYNGGKHRTFYETSLGGYTGGGNPNETGAQDLAKQLNPYTYTRLNDPSRQNVPLGLVFMNYVIPPTSDKDNYKSEELIRAIINNNKAFRLHRSTDGK